MSDVFIEDYFGSGKLIKRAIERYGVESTLSLKDVIKKADDTYTIKYGGRSDMVKQTAGKAKETKLKRYGNENFNNREQAKQTCLERYGVTTYVRPKKIKSPKPKKISRFGELKFGDEYSIKQVEDHSRFGRRKK